MEELFFCEEEEFEKAGPCEVAPYCPMNCSGCSLSEGWKEETEISKFSKLSKLNEKDLKYK